MSYRPDKWVILKVLMKDGTLLHKVLAGWRGGFSGRDFWRINSGIICVCDTGEELVFHGYSGSTYVCHRSAYGTTTLSNAVFQDIRKRFEAEGVQVEQLDEQAALSLEWVQRTGKSRPQFN
jgi:hypothetical protein